MAKYKEHDAKFKAADAGLFGEEAEVKAVETEDTVDGAAPETAEAQPPAEPDKKLPLDGGWLVLPPAPEAIMGQEAPYDGLPVLLAQVTGDKIVTVEAYWRTTRAFNLAAGRWLPKALWSRRYTQQPAFIVPDVYRPIEE